MKGKMNGKMNGKMKGVLLIAVFILSTITLAIPFAIAAEGDEVDLYDEDMLFRASYSTIQAAINAADADDIILVAADTYVELVTIDVVNLTVRSRAGAATTFITGTGSGQFAVKISANSVTFEGFTVTTSTTNVIYIQYDTVGITVTNNIIIGSDTGCGVMLNWDDNSPNSGEDVVDEATVSNNVISHVYTGIATLGGVKDSNFTGNTVTNTIGEGLTLMGGLAAAKTQGNRITGNTFTNATASGITLGVSFQDPLTIHITDTLISGNNISDNGGNGIYIEADLDIDGLVITDNYINDNTLDGIQIGAVGDWDTSTIYYNDIVDNTVLGIDNDDAETINATLNWWGTTSYPGIDAMIDVPVTYISVLSASIDVTPLRVHTEQAPASPGDPVNVTAQGDGSFFVADANTTVAYDTAVDLNITVEDLSVDDVEEATFAAMGEYVDVKINDTDAVEELEIRVSYTDAELTASGYNEPELIMYWYSGTNWLPCSDTGVSTANNYIWAKIRDNTSPTLAQMTGTPLGGGGALAIQNAYYHIDDDVTVTLGSSAENTNAATKQRVTVFAWSTSDPGGKTIALHETLINSGIFVGTFKLVDEDPATAEIVVNEGDTIAVGYEWDTGLAAYAYNDTATVDDTNPTVTALVPARNAITINNQTTISAYVNDAHFKVAYMRVDEVFIDNPRSTYGTITYTPDDLNKLTEGLHTVVVVAKDLAGNVNTTTWTFTVDTANPTATITMNVTGDVKAGDVEFYADFSEGMINNTAVPVFVSNVTTSITFTTPGKWTANQTYTIKAVIGGDYNGTAQVNATGAKDLAEKVMTKASYEFYIDTVLPTPPGKLNATALADSIVLDWLASADFGGVDLYKVYRGIETGECNISLGSVETLTFTDTTLTASGIYFYEVKAYDEAGNSATSNEANATFTAAPITSYNISLVEGWNLISLPLIPDDPDTEVVLADVWDNVTLVYGYNQSTDAWILNPDEMTDGWGYWLYLNDNVTMTVNGTETLPGIGLPVTYDYTEDWVLGGYKEIVSGTEYFKSFEEDSYLAYVLVWNATELTWTMLPINTETGQVDLDPGQGFWIFMYEEQKLIPPIL